MTSSLDEAKGRTPLMFNASRRQAVKMIGCCCEHLNAHRHTLLAGLLVVVACSPRPAAAQQIAPREVTAEDRGFWSFRPLAQAAVPPVRGEAWVRTPIDRFVLAQLESKGLVPNGPADRRTLIRRAYLDVLGIPPAPDEVEAFVSDADENAYEKLIDRLLASPALGERWARHWLDVARFAESDGFEHDYDRPFAYHYRDFVIQALNADMPFDRFVRWQLAGDEWEPDNPLALMATGFLTAGVFPTQLTEDEFERARYDQLDDMVSTTSVAFLALTVGCARCHAHKYDPISTQDYYQMASTFTTTIRSEVELDLELPGQGSAGVAEKKLTKVQVGSECFPPVKHHADDRGFPHFYPQTYFLHRGDPNQKQGAASQGFLQVLIRHGASPAKWQESPPSSSRSSYRRRSLGNWLVDTRDGAGNLAARVIVNRIWQHHLGRGIVATPNDFGLQGERPTHPELLDWLATELLRNDWRLKPIHKLILTSAVYTETAAHQPENARIDPENRALWRHNYRRIEAEAIRDSLLSVGGTLDRSMFGPGTLDEMTRRRSIYFTMKRSQMIPILQLLDSPEALVSQAARPSTTIAPQALLFVNSPFVRDCARGVAHRLAPWAQVSWEQAVAQGYRLALGREPEREELDDHINAVQRDLAEYTAQQKPDAQILALTNFCHVLLSLSEFIYVN
jgi:hypothetical protein